MSKIKFNMPYPSFHAIGESFKMRCTGSNPNAIRPTSSWTEYVGSGVFEATYADNIQELGFGNKDLLDRDDILIVDKNNSDSYEIGKRAIDIATRELVQYLEKRDNIKVESVDLIFPE